ncbi:MAG: hypothetical protein ACLGIB_08380 [Actinomycetota bacterium]
MKLTRAAIAALSLLIVIGPLALTGRTAERICPGVVVDGPWTSIAAPAFTGAGGPDLAAFAVHPQLPFVLYATNGQQVKISDDSSCTWKDFFSVELLPSLGSTVSAANSRVRSIEIPENPIGPAPVYLLIEETVGPIVRPHVVTANGQGGGLDLLSGLPQTTGGVYGLHVAPSDAKVLYLHVRSSPATLQDDIYRSDDGGSSWTKRNGGQATASQGLAVDPLNQNEIWTFGADGLYRSTDGGASRRYMDQVGPPVPLLDIFHPPGKPQRVMAYEAETGTINMTHDGGKTWTRFMGPPGFARSWAHGNEEDQLLLAQHLRVDDYRPPSFWEDVSADYEQDDLSDLQADRSPFPSVFGFTARTIERYTGWNDHVELPDIEDFDPAKIVDDSSLVPAKTKMRLEPGDSKKVDYTFTLPPNAVPLDVFFLVDTSDSMDSSIAGLRKGMQSIIQALEASKIDAMYGAGEIKDYPIPGFGDPTAGDFPYRLNRAIGPVNDALVDALAKMKAGGGGVNDFEESQLTGLYQAATGEGEPGCAAEAVEEGQPCVPPGQGANFRPDAVKVIVNITDYGFHDQAAHPSPPFAQVAEALSAQEVKQIGLAVYGSEGIEGMNSAVADLSEMAELTGTFAPDPLDCDGDGNTDVGAGEPIVCRITDMVDNDTVNIAPAIIETVKAVVQEVEVELVRSDGKPITDVSPAVYPRVDVTEQNALGFGLTFTCPRSLAGTTQDLTLAAKVQGSTVATAAATVTCENLPKAAIAKKPKPPPPPPPVIPVFPPGPVVIPALAPAGPPPVPETISSTQSAAQAQGAVAKQEQQQVQFAVAYAAFRNDEAYALSSYTERRGPSPAPLYLTAAMMSLAASFVAISRNRARTALARSRRR